VEKQKKAQSITETSSFEGVLLRISFIVLIWCWKEIPFPKVLFDKKKSQGNGQYPE
jgi:hypothetical protein